MEPGFLIPDINWLAALGGMGLDVGL
jgi:hypothetical protein